MNAWAQVDPCPVPTSGNGGNGNGTPSPFQKTLSLYYKALAGQTRFPLSVPDLFNATYILAETTILAVTRNGVRLAPVDPGGGGGFTVDLANNVVVLAWPAGDAEEIIVDIFWEATTLLTNVIGQDILQVTAPNALSLLSRVPDGRVFILFVDGRPFFPAVPSPAFTYAGSQITWVSTLYSLNPGDEVVALYTSS